MPIGSSVQGMLENDFRIECRLASHLKDTDILIEVEKEFVTKAILVMHGPDGLRFYTRAETMSQVGQLSLALAENCRHR
jgi:hypothetical protein